jgi:SAM-dependent methyltransferase
MVKEIKKCPICNSDKLIKILERKEIPTNQNLIKDSEKDAINIVRGNIKLLLCVKCEFIFNSMFDLTKLDYGQKYDNNQNNSEYFGTYVSKLAQKIIENEKGKNSTILEIGCGKGYFLKKIVVDEQERNVGYGFDPSYLGKNQLLDGRLNFKKKFFDSNSTKIKTDVVVCRHVIEHIPDPIRILKILKNYLSYSDNTTLYFETPDVNYILKNSVFWDFPYEHCSYFNKNSISNVFQITGFNVSDIKIVFGKQYMWIKSKHNKEIKLKKRKREGLKTIELAKKYNILDKKIIRFWKDKIKRERGIISIWGAGGKGAMFCYLIDPKKKLFNFVIDINPKKHHKFIAGSGHKIINHTEIKKYNIQKIFVMNPNYYDECINLLKKCNIEVELIDIEKELKQFKFINEY